MTPREQVLSVLGSPALSAINDSYHGVHIHGGMLYGLQEPVTSGCIGAGVSPNAAMAQYDSGMDRILVPGTGSGGSSVPEDLVRTTIAHELVHAAADAYQTQSLVGVEEEALAHVAHAAFDVAANGGDVRARHARWRDFMSGVGVTDPEAHPFVLAFELLRHKGGIPRVWSRDELEPLRQALGTYYGRGLFSIVYENDGLHRCSVGGHDVP